MSRAFRSVYLCAASARVSQMAAVWNMAGMLCAKNGKNIANNLLGLHGFRAVEEHLL